MSVEGGDESVYKMVQEYYGKTLQASSDLKTNACCTAGRPPDIIMEALKNVPEEIKNKYYGCGSPLPFGIEGLDVLDLGSGSGRDCYVAANLVGKNGSVTGIDMTDGQLKVARSHIDSYTKSLGYHKPNLKFVKGYIEFLDKAGIESESMDMVISNCVVNLSPNKQRTLEEVYRVLKPGGEFYFSDVYCDRRLPENVRSDPVLFGECLGGALYVEDFRRLCHRTGFRDPRVVSVAPIGVNERKLEKVLGNAKFQSITFQLWRHCVKITVNMRSIRERFLDMSTAIRLMITICL
eukprot:604273_1